MRRKNYMLRILTAAGEIMHVKLPQCVAFAAARGIARDTHCGVALIGEFGVAGFRDDGCGNVIWNEKSTLPGEVTLFDERTTVCV